MTTKPNQSPVTAKGFRVEVSPPSGSVIFTVHARTILMKPDPNDPKQLGHEIAWHVQGQASVWFPATLNEIQSAIGHWLSYYDAELVQHLPALLGPLQALPERQYQEPSTPKGEVLN